MITSAAGRGGAVVGLSLDRRFPRDSWGGRGRLLLHVYLCTWLGLEDGTALWGTDLEKQQMSVLSILHSVYVMNINITLLFY